MEKFENRRSNRSKRRSSSSSNRTLKMRKGQKCVFNVFANEQDYHISKIVAMCGLFILFNNKQSCNKFSFFGLQIKQQKQQRDDCTNEKPKILFI